MAWGCFLLFIALSTSAGLPESELNKYLQPDDVDNGSYDNMSETSSTLCLRECDGVPRICYFRYNIELYSAMGPSCGDCPRNLTDCKNRYCVPADGVHRNIITVNRRLPGSPVQVCLGDLVVVDVVNMMSGKTCSMHWHGLQQRGTPHMDGVYMVTQCPISPGQTFRYKFEAKEAGTHYWHDHSSLIKEDGVQGAVVVRELPTKENNGLLYDYDLPSHSVFLTDWKHYISDDEVPDMKDSKINTLLINGRGAFPGAVPAEVIMEGKGPTTKFRVIPGKSYRFRIIGAMCMECAIEYFIEDHKLLVIASDGNPVEPVLVNSITLLTGERYDVVVTADRDVSSYWMQARGVTPCHQTYQLAVLTYAGAKSSLPTTVPEMKSTTGKLVLNHPNRDNSGPGENNLWISHLKSSLPNPHQIRHPRNRFIRLIQLGSLTYNNEMFKQGKSQNYIQPFPHWNMRSMINNITGAIPPAPMLTQMEDIPKDLFCSQKCLRGLSPENCICLQIFKFPLNSTVDFVVADTGFPSGTVHPFHMHGHRYYVLEQGVLSSNRKKALDQVMYRVEKGLVQHPSPVAKDTLMIPSGGYAVIRFITDNPGIWVFHCHYTYHNVMGMNAYIQAGEQEDFPPPPKGFPKCASFLN